MNEIGTNELADRLRAAGAGDVLTDAAGRSAFGSDASLYRIVPKVIVRPRSDDEVAATLEVSRTLGVPVTARGAGTSIAGNAIGPGIVVDFSRHLNRVLDDRPGHPYGPGAGRHGPGHAAGGGQTVRPALRSRPVDPHPLHHRRDDRQQLVRLADPRLRPDLGQHARADRVHDRRRAPGDRARRQRPAGRIGRGRAHGEPAGAGRQQPGRGADRVRPLRPAGVRLRRRAPAAGTRLQRDRVPGR